MDEFCKLELAKVEGIEYQGYGIGRKARVSRLVYLCFCAVLVSFKSMTDASQDQTRYANTQDGTSKIGISARCKKKPRTQKRGHNGAADLSIYPQALIDLWAWASHPLRYLPTLPTHLGHPAPNLFFLPVLQLQGKAHSVRAHTLSHRHLEKKGEPQSTGW